MLFSEKEILELCNNLGIEVVEKKGYPLLNDIELTPDLAVKYFTEGDLCQEAKIDYTQLKNIYKLDFASLLAS